MNISDKVLEVLEIMKESYAQNSSSEEEIIEINRIIDYIKNYEQE